MQTNNFSLYNNVCVFVRWVFEKMFLKRIPCITDIAKVLIIKVLLFLLKHFCFLDYCVFSPFWQIWLNICVFPTLHLWFKSRLWGKHKTFIIKWIKLAVFGGAILKYIFGAYTAIVWKSDNFFFNTFSLERPYFSVKIKSVQLGSIGVLK